ncbi:MAG: CIA30 family protein [Planctomycetota bacterium]
MNARLLAFAAPAVAALCFALPASAAETPIADFDGKDSLRWETVNDNVMGGRSKGGWQATGSDSLLFEGTTSLENRGGFSSIRSRKRNLGLGEFDGISMRVRGDGRAYKLTARSSQTSSWISYWADFETRAGEWIEVRVPFADMAPTTFGRKLPGRKLRPAKINSIGFMIYDKQAGDFALEVDWIRAYNGKADPTIVELAASTGTFETLLAAATAAGLVDALNAEGPLTVFAPTDEAFAALPDGTLESLLKPSGRAALTRILKHHVIAANVTGASAAEAGIAGTLAGTILRFQSTDGGLTVSGAKVLQADLRAANGTVHVIDRVLIPADLSQKADKNESPAVLF